MPHSMALINRSSPFGNHAGKESLDLALVAGTFEHDIGLFFRDDGVYQLITGQQPMLTGQKDYLKTFAALEFYEVEKLYVCSQSLEQRGIQPEALSVECEVLDKAQWQQTLNAFSHIVVF